MSDPADHLPEAIAHFERIEDRLRAQYGSRSWVVISDGVVWPGHKSFAEAAELVVGGLGGAKALIRQIDEPPVFVPFFIPVRDQASP